MVSTRSKTKQTKIEDYASQNSISKPQAEQEQARPKTPQKANISKKRKALDTDLSDQKPSAKRVNARQKSRPSAGAEENESSDIVINRAPVLQLWAACVTHFIYPQLEWETCLSAGSAISTICAVAKGRSVGTIPDKTESESKQKEKSEAEKAGKDLDGIEIMHFRLHLKDGRALVSSTDAKGKPGSEETLKKKFGDEQYNKTRATFDDALETWKGDEDDLSKQAFGFYEDFRPNVKSGQKRWGKKGALSLDQVRDAVAR